MIPLAAVQKLTVIGYARTIPVFAIDASLVPKLQLPVSDQSQMSPASKEKPTWAST
jgi:hypothetical protein